MRVTTTFISTEKRREIALPQLSWTTCARGDSVRLLLEF